MRERVAALHQEFEAVVEAGGVGLAFIRNRPEPGDILAVQFRMHGRLPRRHPVDVAAQRVDLAVVRDHAIGMRQRPGREGVGGEALVHERERTLEVRLMQVGIILAELVGEEHALVDHRPARQRHRIIAGEAAVAALIDRLRDRLAQDVEPPFEVILGLRAAVAADEYLHVGGFGRLHGLAERRIVGRHVAPAEQRQAFGLDLVGDDALDDFAPRGFARHEQRADGVFAGLRQGEAELLGLARKEAVRDLHQNARAVTGARIGTGGAAMFEVAEDVDRVGHDLVGLLALDVGDEADAAGILFLAEVVKTFRRRAPSMFASRLERFRGRIRRMRIQPDVFPFELRPAHINPVLSLPAGHGYAEAVSAVFGAPWAVAAPPIDNLGATTRTPRATF